MPWNWELPDWPNFTWDRSRLELAEQQFLVSTGVLIGTAKHLDPEDRNALNIELMSNEALTTSEIEGVILDRDSVQSSIRRQLGIATDNRRIPPAEQGVAEMMVSLYQTLEEPLTDKLMFAWHRMLVNQRHDISDIGCYRTQKEPMQVISGTTTSPNPVVHFEAPPSSRMEDEMSGFFAWLDRTAPGGREPLPALTRAGIGHLYFVNIHPFEDGNGRIGRAISEKILAQTVKQPTFTAIAATVLKKRKAYYQALEAMNNTNEITSWLIWFAETAIEAQAHTIKTVEFILEKTRMFDRLRGQLNARQEKALLRMFKEGPDGFKGGLSAANYMSITQATESTTTRDLADLVAKGALARIGELRHARYHLNMDHRKSSET